MRRKCRAAHTHNAGRLDGAEQFLARHRLPIARKRQTIGPGILPIIFDEDHAILEFLDLARH